MHRVWYVAYGSNLASARFNCYLSGGRPLHSLRTYSGCRDATQPTDDRPVRIPGTIRFAGVSTVWGGGVALYDPLPPTQVAGRAYLVTTGQLCDVAAQEMHRRPDADLDLSELLTAGAQHVGSGRYDTLLNVGTLEGRPMITVTARRPFDAPLTPPSAPYLRVIGGGLRETHGWEMQQVADYLAAAPGVRGAWPPEAIAALLEI